MRAHHWSLNSTNGWYIKVNLTLLKCMKLFTEITTILTTALKQEHDAHEFAFVTVATDSGVLF